MLRIISVPIASTSMLRNSSCRRWPPPETGCWWHETTRHNGDSGKNCAATVTVRWWCPRPVSTSWHSSTRHSNKLLTNCSITLLKPPSVKLFLFVFFRSFELNECFPDCVYSELYQWKLAHNNMTAIIVPFCVNFRLHLRWPGARGGRPRQE